ncbi:AsmA-like C-terminal domain-containing protein [Helicobacter cappadocius]|uniref:AsmA-like C-terminal domain-containing protein n=1 Tax=Helicobacter cappadocius TaxID=3063998 RepID=A0AA90PJT7_9HELI|nr:MULTISPECIES: AsmA-like C-terminal domain-containing protein [unclassified Helicobacter]MDO7252612.1 AsmA-like C-terminal domain-containing protein [Helicobacter sp. faydin-H75]MDP2538479.1 AsmA-like C-terminal domain-containing protein [Helicobacter sp. faydin-H76]
MSKIVSKKILSLIIFFVIVLILLFTGYRILSDGFHIKNLKIGKININGLYLKLDNKLILDVKKLDVSAYLKTPSKKSFDIESITDNIKYGIWAISYFQKLSIKNIILDQENQASVIYDGQKYTLQFPNIQANFAIEDNNKDIKLKILDLVLKKMGVQTDGDIIYSTQSRKLGFNLIVSPINEKKDKLYLQGITNLKILKLKAKTSEIKNIDFLKSYLTENEENDELGKWLFEKIKFSTLQIDSAQIQATLTKDSFLPSVIQSANIKATIKEPHIFLDESISPITAQMATLRLEKEKLSIDLQKPNYEDTDLQGSKVELTHLLQSPTLQINILSKDAYYNDSIKNLLKIYNIELPIDSVSSRVDVGLLISLQFLQDSEPIIGVKGQINTQESNISVYKTPLWAKNVGVSLDIGPEYEYVYIDTTDTHYQNIADIDAKITLNLIEKTLQANAKIHKIHISTDNDINTKPYEPNASTQQEALSQTQESNSNNEDQGEESNIATDNVASTYQTQDQKNNLSKKPQQTKFIFPTQKLSPQTLRRKIIEAIKADNQKKFIEDIFYATSKTLPTLDVNMDFSNPESIKLSIPDIGISGSIENNTYSVKANDIGKLYPYSPLLKYIGITNGNADIKTSDFENINFDIQLWNLNIPLYSKDGKKISELSLSGKINKDVVIANSPNNDIAVSIKGPQTKIRLKNMDFNLNEFLESKIPAIEEMLADDNPKTPDLSYKEIEQETFFIREKRKYERSHNIDPSIINLESDNSTITFKEYKIPLDSVNLRIQDGRVAIDATHKNGVANLDLVHKIIFVRANNFSGDFINNTFKTDFIQGGLFSLFGAYKNEIFNGELNIQNTLFKNFVVLQNIINLIDTIPSLIVFKNPNLGTKGYEIQKGHIVFAINKKYIGFERIDLIGTSMDVSGNGIIESDTDEINMNLKISTIKNFSNILNKIPIFGYLILGKEGKISTNVIVNGTLKDPKTQVSLAEDAIKAPFNILRRAFTPIDIIINEVKKEMNESE